MSALDQSAETVECTLSQAFQKFAQPLLDGFDANATVKDIEKVLNIAQTVWNSDVYDAVNRNARYVPMVRNALSAQPKMARLADELLVRKRSLFTDDRRLVGQFRITRKSGQIQLQVDIRDPG